ncbi:Hsp70 family protein [Polyangium aurulentum]|uniref:Hsp70 family protein n=1 Tax=Polyangium aurulentum TaxID=2567896 RepID=UPI0010AE1B25|nr:Hsp70 family protein [Polyangium aurulentum]UQA61924.1 hsp70 family protein [Polyangium aurulentum]
MRRIVGIDLGTTHTVVAWADPAGSSPPRIFPIPQLVSASEVEALDLLPSFLYAPIAGEALPDPLGDAPWVIGAHARRRGGEVPGRLVASSKSWLAHAAVDRTAAILPWGAPEDAEDLPRVSPVDAGARILAHVRRAWNEAFLAHPLEEQEVILTVPASFDEDARELTVEAARRAGLSVRLLEEPQAAFYDYLGRAAEGELDALCRRSGGEALVLVCDVGGGTTDLSLIRVRPGMNGASPEVERVAVGRHLLLGGDNMDLALAHLCEARLVTPPDRLPPGRFGQLVLACRAAKERLLGDDPPDEVPVTVLGAGARLIGGALTTRLSREEAERVVLDGFLPPAGREDRPRRGGSALVAFGLPYERDVAITRHVAHFFARHAPGATAPGALLLNGGVFRAKRIVEKLAEAIARWGGVSPDILPHTDPDLAVARGAVAYGLSLLGRGVRIAGGAPRGYYVGLGARAGEARTAVCVVPRGAREGARYEAVGRTFSLTVGRPVRFDLFTSDEANDAPGAVVTVDRERFGALPPLATAFDPGTKPGEVLVSLAGELSAIGTLDLACVEANAESPRRFRLAFQLREPVAAEPEEAAPSSRKARPGSIAGAGRGRRLEEAREAIERVYGKGRSDVAPRAVKDLVRELERILGDRAAWTAELNRALYDVLWAHHKGRRRSADHERVFWQLAGYCLRPGFGHPLDTERAAGLFSLFHERIAFAQESRTWQHFWIAWRRVAGGLDEAAQLALREVIDPFLAPAEKRMKKPKGVRAEPIADVVDLGSSLERVPPGRRSELGSWLLERTWTERDPRIWAAIGRLGARVPAYASAHHVVSPSVAERWLDHLLREKWNEMPSAQRAAMEMARVTGDRARDVSERVRKDVERRLAATGAREEWLRAVREYVPVEESDRAAFFGEGLPVGIRLVE